MSIRFTKCRSVSKARRGSVICRFSDKGTMQKHGLTDVEARLLETIREDEITELLQGLIKQRSDFSPGDCRGAIQVVEDRLAAANVEHKIYALQEHQPNLIARYPSGCHKKNLLYHAHIDTVPAGDSQNWHFDPFGGEIANGVVYGRGAGDDKGSVAAQVMAMVALARANVTLSGCLQVAIVSDEESGALFGTHWLRKEGILQPDALVVGEQTDNQIGVAERVTCGIDLTVFGKSAHGAMPWAGDNAVMKTARVLTWLEKEYFPKLAKITHPYLPPATLNIGRITGGIQWSIVPESCKVEMDRRLLPGETREEAMKGLVDALDCYAESVEPLKYGLFSTGEIAGNINTSATAPFVQLARESLTACCRTDRELTGYVQTSDGRWFSRDGIPIIIFGPGDPAAAHATDEWVSITQLVEAARFLALLAIRWE
jgi:succinyl-diaminopimelate desuccinylase